MLFPLSDDDRHLAKPARVTWALLIANILVFIYQQQNPAFTWGYAAIPAEITSGSEPWGNRNPSLQPARFRVYGIISPRSARSTMVVKACLIKAFS
ncbi:MAG: hypothetical protein MK179_12870 [Pirellulaceae bacterium]|nr:hypothetical protein [Pirellulaceae bacterium]